MDFVTITDHDTITGAARIADEVMNQEVRHDNIKVTTLAPGSVATGFSGGDESKGADWKIASADIGDIVIDLLQMDTRSLSSYIELRPSKPPKK